MFYGADINKVNYPEVVRNLFQYSQYCVELFFMLSGFLMSYNYKNRIKNYGFIDFAKRKIGKLILPVFVVNLWSLVNNLLIQALVQKTPMLSFNIWKLLISTIPVHTGWIESQTKIGLPMNGTMWFVDVLILCYVIYYIIGRFSNSNDQYIIFCIIMACLGYACITYNWEIPFLYNASGRGYAPFFFGALLYEIICALHKDKARYLALVLLLVSGCGFLVRVFVGIENAYGDFYKYIIYILCPAAIFSALYISPIKRFLSTRVMVNLGMTSMGIYFVHDNLFRSINLINIINGNKYDFKSIYYLPVFILLAIIGGLIWARVFQRISINQ